MVLREPVPWHNSPIRGGGVGGWQPPGLQANSLLCGVRPPASSTAVHEQRFGPPGMLLWHGQKGTEGLPLVLLRPPPRRLNHPKTLSGSPASSNVLLRAGGVAFELSAATRSDVTSQGSCVGSPGSNPCSPGISFRGGEK